MDRHALESFSLVVSLGSMSAAAQRLSVTQPAVSKQIRRLEHELGVRLFHRTPSGLATTAAGRTLAELATELLTEFRRAESIMSVRFRGRAAFRIASPQSTAMRLITPFMAATDPPIVDLDVLAAGDLDAALNGDLDMAIGSLVPPRHRAHVPLAAIPVTAQAPPDQAAFTGEHIDLEALADQTLIVPRTGVQVAVVDATRDALPGLRFREVSTAPVAQALAANGQGVALVTEPPQFGLTALSVHVARRQIVSALYASWDASHYGSRELHDLAVGFREWLEAEWGWGLP